MFPVSNRAVDTSSIKRQNHTEDLIITVDNYMQETLWGGNIRKYQISFDDAIRSVCF